MSLGRADGVQVNEVPVRPAVGAGYQRQHGVDQCGRLGGNNVQAIVDTVARSVLGPFFSKSVTAPSASVQLRVNGTPCSTAQLVLVNWTRARACETAAAKARRRAVVNCILVALVWTS